MNIGAQIADMRGKKPISLRDLAKASSMPHSRISKIEQGHVKPSFKDLVRLAKGLGVSEDTLKEWLEHLSSEVLRVS